MNTKNMPKIFCQTVELTALLLPSKMLLTINKWEFRIRAANKQEREEDDNQGPPLRLLKRLLQPELTNQTSEKNNRTTNHLPDGNGNPEEADKHNERSKAIANSRPENLVVNTFLRSSIFRVPKSYFFGLIIQYIIVDSNSGLAFTIFSFLQAVTYK